MRLATLTYMNMRRAILTCALAILGVVDGAWGQGTAPANEAKAVFAGGCFWCMQPPFDHVPGVTATLVGYAGGREENPTYKQVSAGKTSHRESIEVTYDPTKVSYDKLLEVFWHNINPMQRNSGRPKSTIRSITSKIRAPTESTTSVPAAIPTSSGSGAANADALRSVHSSP